jgi:protein-tyrosine phosphatase
MNIFWVDEFENGLLGMMPRPKGGSELSKEIQTLSNQKVDCVVCLIEQSEMEELDLLEESAFCEKVGITFIHFPIKDFHLPEQKAYFSLLDSINERLQKNQKIVIHCRAGIGRTGTITAGLLLKNKIHTENIFEYLSKIRTCEVPDTKEQRDWVLGLEF